MSLHILDTDTLTLFQEGQATIYYAGSKVGQHKPGAPATGPMA